MLSPLRGSNNVSLFSSAGVYTPFRHFFRQGFTPRFAVFFRQGFTPHFAVFFRQGFTPPACKAVTPSGFPLLLQLSSNQIIEFLRGIQFHAFVCRDWHGLRIQAAQGLG